MATRVKQIALKDLDATIKAAVENLNTARGLKLKGPIINGIIVRPEALKDLTPQLAARHITQSVAAAVKDLQLTPRVIPGEGGITVGYIIRERVVAKT
jgi:hypothetical protein